MAKEQQKFVLPAWIFLELGSYYSCLKWVINISNFWACKKKLDILHDTGRLKNTVIAAKYRIAKSTVSMILKHREKNWSSLFATKIWACPKENESFEK